MANKTVAPKIPRVPGLSFSDHFAVDPSVLARYGALDVSLVADLPLFVDPFLLFHSSKPEYQALHQEIIAYLRFLRSKANSRLDPGSLQAWYRFKEVRQNWLGFSQLGNEGHALGPQFAAALNSSLEKVLTNFGSETVTRSSHLEKALLIRKGVGRDGVSDLTTNLIKHYLLRYTEKFALSNLTADQRQVFAVTKSSFNFQTEAWQTGHYELPVFKGDFVLLTPLDLLTRDDTWINHDDMIKRFPQLPPAVADAELRATINNYFGSLLSTPSDAKDRALAAEKVIEAYPELIDVYIRLKEDDGDSAHVLSAQKTLQTREILVDQVRSVVTALATTTSFYEMSWSSYDECLSRVKYFKQVVENEDGYKLLHLDGARKPQEADVQRLLKFVWFGTQFDVNREPNNGGGPVDYSVSMGSADKTLIEIKVGSNSQLKRNLQNQLPVYAAANNTSKCVSMIVCFTEQDQERVRRILNELDLQNEASIIVIDARTDNKPTGSKA